MKLNELEVSIVIRGKEITKIKEVQVLFLNEFLLPPWDSTSLLKLEIKALLMMLNH